MTRSHLSNSKNSQSKLKLLLPNQDLFNLLLQLLTILCLRVAKLRRFTSTLIVMRSYLSLIICSSQKLQQLLSRKVWPKETDGIKNNNRVMLSSRKEKRLDQRFFKNSIKKKILSELQTKYSLRKLMF